VLDFLVRTARKASDETILTFIRGEASPRFVAGKLPKLLVGMFR
jgi:hypothetical protein